MVGSSSSSQEHRSCSSAPKTCDHAPPAGPAFPARSFDAAQLLPALDRVRYRLPARGRLAGRIAPAGLPASSGSVTDQSHGLRRVMQADEDGTSACIRVPPGILTF